MVERFNRTLLDMLSTAVGNRQADWQQHICKLCLDYNCSIHSSTGFTPFFLMFRCQVKLHKSDGVTHYLRVCERQLARSILIGGRKSCMTKKYMGSHLAWASWCGYTPQLFLVVNPENYTTIGKDPLRSWNDWARACTKSKLFKGGEKQQLFILTGSSHV